MAKRKYKTAAEKAYLREEAANYSVTKRYRFHLQTGRCINGCGKLAGHAVTCGELECIRKWLNIGTLCRQCKHHFSHDTKFEGFCCERCYNRYQHAAKEQDSDV